MAAKNPYIIIIPGLGDDISITQFWINRWPKTSAKYEVWSASWEEKNDLFEQKLQRLNVHIKKLNTKGYKVSLVGISAGASLVCNALIKNPDLVHKAVNICGRLRLKKSGLPTLEIITFRNKEYLESIKQFESYSDLTPSLTRRIMTFSGFYDELVPVSTIGLNGAENRYIPFIGHNSCISLTLCLFYQKILDFISS